MYKHSIPILLLLISTSSCSKKCKYCEIDHVTHYNYKSDIDSAFIEKDYCGKELDEVEGANNSVRLYYKGDSLTTVYIYSECR